MMLFFRGLFFLGEPDAQRHIKDFETQEIIRLLKIEAEKGTVIITLQLLQ